MNTYIFKLSDGSEIEVAASTRLVAMEMFEEWYYVDGAWIVDVVGIEVK